MVTEEIIEETPEEVLPEETIPEVEQTIELISLKQKLKNENLEDKFSDNELVLSLNEAKEKINLKLHGINFDPEMELEKRYIHIQVDLALFYILKLGNTEQKKFSENGVSGEYISEDDLLRKVVPYLRIW